MTAVDCADVAKDSLRVVPRAAVVFDVVGRDADGDEVVVVAGLGTEAMARDIARIIREQS